jgi:ABC-2 type transport system ATP-binding protein
MNESIVIEHLSHRFNGTFALHDNSYEVRAGEVFALLGPNGAGKTTTIRLLNGLYTPSEGSVRVFGKDPRTEGSAIRKETGVLTETTALYERLTARENMLFFGRLYGLPESLLLKRTQEILRFFELNERADDRVSVYSKGMKQRLALARAFLNHPRVLYLDEPTASLDPESTLQVHKLIESLSRGDGRTVFLCTHHLSEAEKLADRVAILNKGNLLALGTLDELAKRFNPGLWVDVSLISQLEDATPISKMRGVLDLQEDGRSLHIQVQEEVVIPALVNELVRHKAEITRVSPRKVSLEDIYFKLQNEVRESVS